jgi:hypothetical protein
MLRCIPLHRSASTCIAQNAREAAAARLRRQCCALAATHFVRSSRSNSRLIFNVSASVKSLSHRTKIVSERLFFAVTALRQAAAPPRFDVKQPTSYCSGLETFRCHRRSSHAQGNPICTSDTRQKEGARTGRLRVDVERRDWIAR